MTIETEKNSDTLNIEKEKREIDKLEKESLNKALYDIAPNYEKDFKQADINTKRNYLKLFSDAKTYLWEDFCNEFLSKNVKYKKVPLNEMISFILKILLNEQNKELLKTKELILTTDELKELHQAFESTNRKKELEKFIIEQLNENITSPEIIKWTLFAKKLELWWKNPEEFIKNVDNVWFVYLQSNLENISKDTLRNMATWMTFTFIKLFEKSKWRIPNFIENIQNPNELLKIFLSKDGINFIEKTELIIKAIKNIKNEEQNEILMNPEKFNMFYYDVLIWNKDENTIQSELEKTWKYDKNNINIEKLKNIANNASSYITKENVTLSSWLAWLWSIFGNVKGGIDGFQKHMKQEVLNNSDNIISFKEMLETMWIFKYIKDFFNKILKLIWFENGWDDFEKEIGDKNFSNIIEYFKKNITFEKIKTNTESLFYAWFKNNLWDSTTINEKIENIKINWKLSYKSYKYLDSMWANNIKDNLDNLFKTSNFEKLFENEDQKKDFYKNTFKIEKIKQQQNWQEIKINIWIIDFNKIDETINKHYDELEKNTIINNYNNAPIIPETGLNNEKKKEITNFLQEQNDKIQEEVKNLYKINDFSYIKYINAIWKIESWLRYDTKNGKSGALWKYQFMPYTLTDYKHIICWKNTDCNINTTFLSNPLIQEKVMVEYTLNHIKQITNNKNKAEIKSAKNLIYYLSKTHLWWIWNINKNYSDGNITQNEYSKRIVNDYNKV